MIACQKCKDRENNRHRVNKEMRKAMGVCVRCGKEDVEFGFSACKSCRDKQAEQKRMDRAFKLENGICPRCGINKLFGSEKACPECRAKKCIESEKHRAKRTDEDKAKINEQQKDWWHKRVEAGYCGRCGKRKAIKGYKSCGVCRQKYLDDYEPIRIELKQKRKEERSYRIDNHLCVRCGGPALDGMKLCDRHYQSILKVRNHPNTIAYREKMKKSFKYGKELRNA